MHSSFKVIFRGALIGVVQECAALAITTETIDKQRALTQVLGWMALNIFLFLLIGGVAATVSENLTISEAEWRRLEPQRAFGRQALYHAFITWKVPEDAPPNLGITIRFLQVMAVLAIFQMIIALFGISPGELVRGILHVAAPPSSHQ